MSFTSEQSILIFIVLVLSILLLWIVSINKRRRVAKQIIKASGNSITTTIIDRQVRVSLRRESILSDPQFRYICKDFNTEILYKSEWATEEYSPGNTVSVYIDPAKSDIYFVDLSSVHPGSSPYQQAIEKEFAIRVNHLDTVLQAKNRITKWTAIMALLLSIMLFLIFWYITITQFSIGLLVLVCIFWILLYATLRWTIYQFLSSKSKDL